MVAKTTDDENGGVVCVSLQDVNRYKGKNYPIMNLQERVLSVLACRVGERERERNSVASRQSWGGPGARLPTLCDIFAVWQIFHLHISIRS